MLIAYICVKVISINLFAMLFMGFDIHNMLP